VQVVSMQPAVIVTSLIGASAVLVWRLRETRKPLTVRKIVIPPIGMSTGLLMFLAPATRIPLSWAAAAFATGVLVLSYPMIKTSTLTREGNVIMLKRSRAFLGILLGLVAIRIGARAYIEQYIDSIQSGSVFFLLAFGMIVTWRCWMFMQFRALNASSEAGAPLANPHVSEAPPVA
jgi:membrane protein CcdC involved in cytochrome C biogenesis